MPKIALILLGLLILISVMASLTFTFVHWIVMFAIAGFVGWLADLVVPGELPFGWLGAILAGIVGGWIGGAVLGNFGPSLWGVNLIPTFLGAVVLAAGVRLVAPSLARR